MPNYFTRRRINRTRNRFSRRFEFSAKLWPAVIGSKDGSSDVAFLGEGWTWVHVWGADESLIPVKNPTAINEPGTGVLISRDPRPPYSWRIIGVNDAYSSDTAQIPWGQYETGVHGSSHQTADESSPGPDPTYVFQPMMYILKTVGDGLTLSVTTHSYNYIQDGIFRHFPGKITNLTSSVPGSGLTRYVLLYLNRDTNVLGTVEGATATSPATPPFPQPPAGVLATRSAWVQLTNGQTAITTATHIVDPRDFLGSASSSGNGETFDVNTIVTDANGDVVVDANGNVVVAG